MNDNEVRKDYGNNGIYSSFSSSTALRALPSLRSGHITDRYLASLRFAQIRLRRTSDIPEPLYAITGEPYKERIVKRKVKVQCQTGWKRRFSDQKGLNRSRMRGP